jgi:transcriptional regulator of NAD metabolism
MNSAETRRTNLLRLLQDHGAPLSGSALAKMLGVTRQIIVQDIAVIRAGNHNILSTNKGYILFREDEDSKKVQRSMCVHHSDEDILTEFQCIVDYGAKVLDVVVEHELYGQISVDLLIQSRQDAVNFMEQMKNCQSRSLNILTDGIHYHTVEAESEEILDMVENALKNAGILVS